MPRYEPIDAGIDFKASISELLAFKWEVNAIQADFDIPEDRQHLLRVRFDRQCIVRILDEMALSTEQDDGPNEGLIPEHFAYRVRNAAFFRAQSEAWREGFSVADAPVTHYRFLTGWACLDVISPAHPHFEVVDR